MFKSEGVTNFDNPMFKDWLQFRYDMENVDKCQVPYADVKAMSMNYRSKFFNGEIAMLPIASFLISELDDQEKYPHDFVTTFAPIPAWGDAKSGSTYTDSLYYSVSSTTKHPQEAYDFIRFYTTKGMDIKGNAVSVAKGTNKMDYLTKMIDDPKYTDMETLDKVLNNPNWKNDVYTIMPSYNKEMSSMMVEEAEKFLLGEERDLDKVTASMQKRGEEIISNAG